MTKTSDFDRWIMALGIVGLVAVPMTAGFGMGIPELALWVVILVITVRSAKRFFRNAVRA